MVILITYIYNYCQTVPNIAKLSAYLVSCWLRDITPSYDYYDDIDDTNICTVIILYVCVRRVYTEY